MNDLRLDPVTHDLVVSNFDLSIIEGAERVRQNLVIKLRLWTGEWYLDTDFGTPYLQSILGKQITLGGAVAALKKSILEVDSVEKINSFNFNFDRRTRKFTVDFEVSTPFGIVQVSA